MMSYREQLSEALRAVHCTSATSFAWFGVASRPPPRAVTTAMTAATLRDRLVASLADQLYRSFYTQGRPEPREPARTQVRRADQTFVRALSNANAGGGGWEPGWRIEALAGGSALVAGHGLRARALIDEFRPEPAPTRVGGAVGLRRPKESATAGFYTALGDLAPTRRATDVETRIYVNVGPARAAALVAACTRLLNAAAIPFDLKLVDHPAGYARCDPVVLYLGSGALDRLARFLPAIISATGLHLRPRAPAFAKPIVPGVAVGEHLPALGGSFGSFRCRLVADGIVSAFEHGASRLEDRLDAVAARFADHGLDLDLPYLAPRSGDRYVR